MNAIHTNHNVLVIKSLFHSLLEATPMPILRPRRKAGESSTIPPQFAAFFSTGISQDDAAP
jgi:hypothetical protein